MKKFGLMVNFYVPSVCDLDFREKIDLRILRDLTVKIVRGVT